MSFEAEKWDAALNQAIDQYADFQEEEAEKSLLSLIQALKESMDATPMDAERYYFWGRSLVLLEEPEQALLRFEQALQLIPGHEGALWETASLLLDTMERPEGAKAILEQRLLTQRPDSERYREALAAAETLIRRKAAKPLPPDVEGGEDASPDLPS